MFGTTATISEPLLTWLFPATGRHRAPDASPCPGAADASTSRLTTTTAIDTEPRRIRNVTVVTAR